MDSSLAEMGFQKADGLIRTTGTQDVSVFDQGRQRLDCVLFGKFLETFGMRLLIDDLYLGRVFVFERELQKHLEALTLRTIRFGQHDHPSHVRHRRFWSIRKRNPGP